MAYFTPNLNLKKPAQTDFYDVDDFNGNMDILDAALVNGDCGSWEDDVAVAIEAHNANPLAHQNITIDGINNAIDTHDTDAEAHQNLETDGGNQ